MSWRAAWVPDGRGGFRRVRPLINTDEDNIEESGEVHESSKNNNDNDNDNDNNSNNNNNNNNNNSNNSGGGNQHKSTTSYQPSPPHQQYHHSNAASKRNGEENNEYSRRSSSPFPSPSLHNDFRGGGVRGPREFGRDGHRDIPRGGRGGRFGGGGRGWQRNPFSGGGRGNNDGSSHYGRDFRNEPQQPPPPPPPPSSRDFGVSISSSNGDSSPPCGSTDCEAHSSKNRGISRESSWDGRGGFRRSSNNNNSNSPPQNEDNAPQPRIHRDSSFGGSVPPPSSHRNDHRDGTGREPAFRDGGGGTSRDGHPHPKKKGSPLLSFVNKRDLSSGRGDDPPPPPPLYLGQECSSRDQTSGRGSEDLVVRGSSETVDRIRIGERKRDPSTSSSYQVRASFGQGGPNTGSPLPTGCILPRDSLGPHTGTGTVQGKNDKLKVAAGSGQGSQLSSRPTDPRRRSSTSTSKEIGNSFTHAQGSIPTVASDDGSSISSNNNNRNIDVLPPGVSSSPNPPHRLSSYSSLAGSTAQPGASNTFRSPAIGARCASSDSMPWLERSGPFPTGNKKINKNPMSSSNQPTLSRNGDPRFKRTDDSSIVNAGSAHRGDSHKISEPKHFVDPFGRSRDWNQKLRPIRRLPSGDGPRISPTKNKPVKSFLSTQSPQSKEKTLLSAPKLTMFTSSMTNTSNNDSATSASATSTADSAKKTEKKIEPLSPLLLSSLGNSEVLKRAETVVLNLHEVMSVASSNSEIVGNIKELPSKTEIMSAVEEIEKLVRKTKSEVDETEEATKNATDEEKGRKAQKATRVEEEKKKNQFEIEKRKKERRKEEENSKTLADREAQDQSKVRFEEELKKLEADLEGKLMKAKAVKKVHFDKELQLKISEASTVLDKSIAKARRDMEKSKLAAQKISKKLATAEKGYKAIVESEKKKKQKRKKPIKRDCIPLVDIVNSITLENKRKVKEAHMLAFCIADPHLGLDAYEFNNPLQIGLYEDRDPKFKKTFEEWSIMAKQVTGLSTRLYSEPSETPYYEQNERNHASIGPLVKEYVRDKQIRLTKHWTMLAEEYEVRKRLYEKHQRKLAKKARVSITSRKSILGNKESKEKPNDKETKIVDSSGRSSNNPYRRARRGNEVRSEYEQEQIIAEIGAREAMEKRITHGGSKLPRQICPLERELTASYVNTFASRRIDNPIREAEEEASTNIWTDMEKCIFLDRFLQFPKDFRRIASFLKNKTTKDCVAFYYDSKQTVPYKGALKEHMMRRKRKGDYQVWDASIQAAVSAGALITAGVDEEKPINFSVPGTDLSYNTRMLHPLKREVFDSMVIDATVAEEHEDRGRSEDARWKSRKRGRDPLFSLDKAQIKFLRQSSQDSMSIEIQRTKSTDEPPIEITEENNLPDLSLSTPMRKAPQKWTTAEKQVFVDTLEKHGRNWAMLSRAVGTKSISQIKNFYYDYKKQSGKVIIRPEKKCAHAENNTLEFKTIEISQEDDKIENDNAVVTEKRRETPPLAPQLTYHTTKCSKPLSLTPPPQATNHIQSPTQKVHNTMGHELLQRQQELLQRQAVLQHQQELQQLQRRTELGMSESHVHDRAQESVMCDSEIQPETSSNVSGPPQSSRSDLAERFLSSADFPGNLNNNEMIQQFLKQQAQQQKHNQLELQLRQHQQQQHQQQQQQRQQQQQQQHPPQSALHQILSRHHHQREQQQTSQHQVPQRSHEDSRRRLQAEQHSQQHSQQQQQQQQQQTMSNLFSSWSPASQLLQAQAQAQNRMHHAQYAAALQQEVVGSQENGTKPDLPDIANLQRLLQMQQFQQNLMGLNSSSGTRISAGLLAQLEGFGGTNRNSTPVDQQAQGPDISALANAQSLLGYTTTNTNNNNNSNVGGGVSDAFALLTRHMQRDNRNNQHGFGGTDRQG